MRLSPALMSEARLPFLRVLALFEKLAVIDSIDSWQLCRTARNLAAHDYETDYALIAEHFNELRSLQPVLIQAASKLLLLCGQALSVAPATADFESEFRTAAAATDAWADRGARNGAKQANEAARVQEPKQ